MHFIFRKTKRFENYIEKFYIDIFYFFLKLKYYELIELNIALLCQPVFF